MHHITGHARLLALIADPVVQARTPDLANAVLQSQGLDNQYTLLPLQVTADNLVSVIAGLRGVGNFAGAVVSMPHKQSILPLLDSLSDEARAVGAVNVIRRDEDGKLHGGLMDGEGFVAGLESAGHGVSERHIFMAGAGGAASAIAWALAKYGCRSLTLHNRHTEKAEALADKLAQAFPALTINLADTKSRRYDIAINATPLGMHSGDALPFDIAVIQRSTLVTECVLAPEMTVLLQMAKAEGKAVHTGLPMLQGQLTLMLQFMGVPLR